MDKNNPLKEPLKVEKNAPVRNVVRFWLIALAVAVVAVIVFSLIFGSFMMRK
ncbi:MAG TPA: hypothetical protein VF634_08425 [Pyrinomonadaceae bacterium]|jgi:cell division protein FtsB